MTTHSDMPHGETLAVKFDQLSKGIDRVLDRWTGDNRPTKLTLLNDLAASIRPGANWSALKADATKVAGTPLATSHASLIPMVKTPEADFPARLCPVRSGEHDLPLAELIEEVQPLFSLHHDGDPIIGLELSVTDGNGYCDASIYNRLIVLRDGVARVDGVHAYDLSPDAARLIYCAIQNLQSTELYPVFAQSACGSLRVLIGPTSCAVSLPEIYARGAPASLPSQGLRVLFDEGDVPSAGNVDIALRLASAALPHLGLGQFPADAPVQFKLSEPLTGVWASVPFDFSDALDDRPMFREPGTQDWTHNADLLYDAGIQPHGTLGESLDLALALIDVDDPYIYLKVSLISGPKNPRGSSGLKPGWRGGFHRAWEVLRLRHGHPAECLSLDAATRQRFETGFNGWALREGYSLTDDPSLVKAEALIARDSRRASHHLKQVAAIMEGADPTDDALMKSLES
ncbi:hypothetical protein [uncultured Roseobacter sp.]|uniref:hypothetical protein n=1 Tax=uncultured Roseobacter sp. TaxID=114847 RepID=UPI00260B595B|nr:hypothetical protein [uncultured Roseobacter sp.]